MNSKTRKARLCFPALPIRCFRCLRGRDGAQIGNNVLNKLSDKMIKGQNNDSDVIVWTGEVHGVMVISAVGAR